MGHEVVEFSADQKDIIEKVRGCDGLLWRFTHSPQIRLHAKRLLPAIEQGLEIPVFPDWRTSWHYDDKIAQAYLLPAANIPVPKTWVFYDFDSAVSFCRNAAYPLVIKLTGGASSQNVRLLKSFEDSYYWICRLFGSSVTSLEKPPGPSIIALRTRFRGATRYFIKGWQPHPGGWHDQQTQYLFVQEFLPGNAFDTRVTVIGNRAFAFRRFNRPGDFRSSGSGDFDVNPLEIDMETVRMAFRVAKRLGTQSIAIDGLRKGNERVVGEISYTYASWVVHECPGYWLLHGDIDQGQLEWVEGHVWPENIILDDFISRIQECTGIAR
jgi:glutathione synthase/RimK-type ligase-like ATP-grasp enzyme